MKGSKKVIIGLSVLSAVLVAVVISMAAVLASFQAVSQNHFDVSYNAGANVKATVKTEYQVLKYDTAHTGEGFIVMGNKLSNTWKSALDVHSFDGSETAEITEKEGTATIDGAFENKYDILIIRFTITNNGSSSITVKGATTSESQDTNMIVNVAENVTGTTAYTFGSSKPLAIGATLEVYVQVRVSTYTQSARFARNYAFTLNAV